ncbi:replication protein [Escherichia coli]
MNILPLLDRPIAFQRSFIRLEMGVTAALFLSQLTYWTNRTTDDGWVYKTQDEWEEETGLSRYEQEGARKKLRGLGVLLERKQGLPARLYYKIDNDVLCQLLTSAYKDAEKPHTGEGKTTRPVRGKPTNILTENTTEIITDGESADADTQQPADQRINYQVILDTYHEILPEMPPVKILTDGRKNTFALSGKNSISMSPVGGPIWNLSVAIVAGCWRTGQMAGEDSGGVKILII